MLRLRVAPWDVSVILHCEVSLWKGHPLLRAMLVELLACRLHEPQASNVTLFVRDDKEIAKPGKL